jgi:hypothetical protein
LLKKKQIIEKNSRPQAEIGKKGDILSKNMTIEKRDHNDFGHNTFDGMIMW